VPIQPRNANGTFAPCPSLIEEEKLAALAAEKRLNKDKPQGPDRDIIRISSQPTFKQGVLGQKELFKIGKKPEENA